MSTSEIPDYDPDHPRPMRPEEIEAIKAKYDTGMTREQAEAAVRVITQAENFTQNG
ncbi:hypothetical protein SEA_NIAGARA_5 [Gordonia phage Niagara]|nr:hypothetical protein SEA_NIAGARA_5 [Gordonia phage Niagara]